MGITSDKEKIINSITKSASLYKNHLLGKTFLYVFEGQFIEVAYHINEFKHLTGVATSLSANSFYNKALDGILQKNQVWF